MKKLIFPLVLLLSLANASSADAAYKITASVVDIQQVCFIRGQVTDEAGNPVYPVEVTFTCGSIKTSASVIPGGYYIGNPPPCANFTITAVALGKEPASRSGLSVGKDEIYPLDLTFSSKVGPRLEDAILSLQILSDLQVATAPPDYVQDGKIGLDDAIYALQEIAQMRRSLAASSPRKAMSVALEALMTATLSRDTDGDGTDDWFQTQTTDTYGYLEITGLMDGVYNLVVTSADNSSATRIENITIAGEDVDLKTLRLKPVGSMSGKVELEGASNHGDSHVYIPGTSYGAYTDSSGNFVMSNVPEGAYAVRAAKANYGAITINEVSVISNEDSAIPAFMLPSVVGSVTGSVWLQGAADYTGILITLRRDIGTTYLTTTDSAGAYAFLDVPIGTYQLTATMPGFVSQQTAVTVLTGSNTVPSRNLAINTNKGTLKGAITLDNVTDDSGTLVSVAGTGFIAITDANGFFTLPDIPQGTYTVFVKADGYVAKRFENIQITKAQETILNTSLVAQSTIIGNTASGSIAGLAFYSDQSDQSGINIKLEGTAIPLTGTDRNGGFIINNIPPGTYTLLFTQANYKTVIRAAVEVVPWDTTFLRTVMMIPPVGSVRGTARVEGFDPYADVYTDVDVYATYDPQGTSGTTHPVKTNGGQFLLENVKEGTVTIVVTKPGFNSASVAGVMILAGQTSILEDPILLKTPPLAPTGATVSQTSGSSIKVFWTASTSPDVAGYNVYYGTRSDAIDQKANTQLVTGTSYDVTGDVTGLEKGITYYFAVKAVDADGLVSPLSPSDGSLKATIHPTWKTSVLAGGYEFNYPFDIALTPDGAKGYVSSRVNACLLRIDFSNASPYVSSQINLTGTLPVPSALAMNPVSSELYVVDQNQNKLFVLNTSSDTFSPSSITVGSTPQNVIVSQDGSRIYVCSAADNVTVINAATKEIVTTIPLGEDSDPYGMAIVNNRLYLAGTWSNKVYMIDLDSESANYHKVIGPIAVGNGAYDLAARPDGAFIYVSHTTADGAVSVIDTGSNTVVKTITVKNSGETANKNPKGMAVEGHVLYVLNWGDSTVTMINTQDNTKLDLGSPLITGGNGPENLVVSPDGSKLYIVHSSIGSVEILGY